MDRRTFLGWVGVGWVASSLPVAIVACSSNSTKNQTASISVRSDGFQPVGTVAELNQKGQILNKEVAGKPVMVIRDPNQTNRLIAVNPTCPHRDCLVAWKSDKKAFICPCHDSEFTADGKVIKDPAKEPLLTYEAKIEGESIVVKVV